MKIYTRTGDTGQTSLFGGGRVDKHHLRVAAYGDVDEMNSVLGAAIACEPQEFEGSFLESIQRDLFSIGGQLATPDREKVGPALEKADLSASRIPEFEAFIDSADAELPTLEAFVLPGGTMKAALFHHARTVCRRAERAVVALSREDTVPEPIIAYLNRLSDVLFTLARLANHRANVPDQTW
jgi:cob(I)alamin adenosyltransferase